MQQVGGLPGAYQHIEWLESTGTQYFWTNIKLQEGLTVESKQTFKNGDTYLFGAIANTSSNSESSCFNGNFRNGIQGRYPKSYYILSESIPEYNVPYVIKTTNENGYITVYKDGVLVSNQGRGNPIEDADVYCVCFGARRGDGTVFQKYKGKLYSLKVSKNGSLLANYIPCVRIADSKPGMYDTVSRTFYTNDGTGEFGIPA